MLKIFAFCALLFCGGCLSTDTSADGSAAGVVPVSAARRTCRENMLEVRTAENWRQIRDELQKQTLQIAIPGRLARLTGTDGTREEARRALYLAQLYLQELTAPDTAAARKLLARRSEELLDMEFSVLAGRIFAAEREIAALEDVCSADPQAKVPAERLRECRSRLAIDRLEMRTLLGIPAGVAFLLKPDEPADAPPPADTLSCALAGREELRGSPFSPSELAAAVHAYRARRNDPPIREAFTAALLLLRVPRDLYRRELAGKTELVGMRELLTAIGIGAELALAEEELQNAARELETASLTGVLDPRSRAEIAHAEGRLAVARAHLAAALGSGPRATAPKLAVPPEKLKKLLTRLEKYDHE